MKNQIKPIKLSLTAQFEAFKVIAKAHIASLRYPAKRVLLSVDAADAQGKLNGMTIVELITVTQLMANQNERVFLSVRDKTLTLTAEQIAPYTPMALV